MKKAKGSTDASFITLKSMPGNNRFLTQQIFYFRSQFPEKRKWIISLKKQKANGSSFGPKSLYLDSFLQLIFTDGH